MSPFRDTAGLSLTLLCGTEGSSERPRAASCTWRSRAAFSPPSLIALDSPAIHYSEIWLQGPQPSARHPRSITTLPGEKQPAGAAPAGAAPQAPGFGAGGGCAPGAGPGRRERRGRGGRRKVALQHKAAALGESRVCLSR